MDNMNESNKKVLGVATVARLWVRMQQLVIKKIKALTKADVGLGNVTDDAQVKRSEMGVAGGVATLGTDGKVPKAQLPELDLSLYKVVESLPNADIDPNKIYLVRDEAGSGNNKYKEYLYLGDPAQAYDPDKWELQGEFSSDVNLTEYVKFTDLASAEKAGAMSAGDKTRLDGIFAGNMPLVDVAITSAGWTVYKSDGVTEDSVQTAGSSNVKALILETGYKVKFSGRYKWTAATGKKSPTLIDPSSSWSQLTPSGQESDLFTSGVTGTNATYKVKIGAPKTGLMVSGQDVKPAAGNDYKEASVSVTFKHRMFTGMVSSKDITAEMLQALSGEMVTSPNTTKNGVTANASQYYVMAYPKVLGDLTKIIQDGATPVLGAFTKKEVSVTNGAGYVQAYNVYVSNNPGAFTNASLQFVK